MHKKIIGGLVMTGLLFTLATPLAVRAWSPLVIPNCDTGPMVGRDRVVDTGVRAPYQIDQNEEITTNALGVTAIFDYHGPATYGRSSTIYGVRINPEETQLRATMGNLVNGLKMECILQNVVARLGFSFTQRIDDTAAYDLNTRNHSLYQRTNDLQAEMAAMREEMAALRQEIRRVNALNSVGGTSPASASSPSVTIPVVPLFAPAPAPLAPSPLTPSVPKKDDSSNNQACIDACGRAQIVCMKQANTSKALIQCSTDRTQCESTCK